LRVVNTLRPDDSVEDALNPKVAPPVKPWEAPWNSSVVHRFPQVFNLEQISTIGSVIFGQDPLIFRRVCKMPETNAAVAVYPNREAAKVAIRKLQKPGFDLKIADLHNTTEIPRPS
jgi:hypothetical protein